MELIECGQTKIQVRNQAKSQVYHHIWAQVWGSIGLQVFNLQVQDNAIIARGNAIIKWSIWHETC